MARGKLTTTQKRTIDRDSGIQEFNLERHIFNRLFLPDKLVQSRLADFPRSVGAGIGAMIVAGSGAVQFHSEANGRSVLRRAQDHMEIAAVEAEHNPAGAESRVPFSAWMFHGPSNPHWFSAGFAGGV